MPGLFPNPSAAPEAFRPGDQVRWYVGDAHISPYVGVVVHIHPGIQKVDVDFPVGGVQRMAPEDLILVTRFEGETTVVPGGGDYSSYDKSVSDKGYGTMSQNLRDLASRVVAKKASQDKPMVKLVAERFASDVVDRLASDILECASRGLKDIEAYQSVYSKYASRCSDVFLRGAVRRVYALAAGSSSVEDKARGILAKWVKIPRGGPAPEELQEETSAFLDSVDPVHYVPKGCVEMLMSWASLGDKHAPASLVARSMELLGGQSKSASAAGGETERVELNKISDSAKIEQLKKEGWKPVSVNVKSNIVTLERPKQPSKPVKRWSVSNTELDTWSERDRDYVILKTKHSGNSIMEWWDEAVGEAIEDGFLGRDKRNWHQDAVDYANERGLWPRSAEFWHEAFQEDGKRRREMSEEKAAFDVGER